MADTTQAILRWDVVMDQSYPITYDIVVMDEIANAVINTYTVSLGPLEANPYWTYDPADNNPNQFTITGLTANRKDIIKVVIRDAVGNANTERYWSELLHNTQPRTKQLFYH